MSLKPPLPGTTGAPDFFAGLAATHFIVAGPTGVAATDQAAIEAAIDAASDAGGGVVYLRPGTYRIGAGLTVLSGVHLCGAGRGVTTLFLANATNNHALAIAPVGGTASGVTVSDLTIDANRANQTTAGHGIRVHDGVDISIVRVIVKNCYSYGIGIAQSDGTSVKRLLVDDVYIYNTGLDGIDCKDKLGTNDANRISNLVVENHGQNETQQAGVDCRGPWQLNNVTVLNVSGNDVGFRFRENSGDTGFGCDGSSLTNFRVIGDNAGTGSYGVSVASDNVHVGHGYIESTVFGVASLGANNTVDGVVAKDCVNLAGNDGEGFVGDGAYNTFTGCIADGCWDGFVISGANCEINGGASINSGRYGLIPDSNYTLRMMNPPKFANNATNNILFSSVPSAATLPLPGFMDTIPVSGTTTITAFTGLWPGRIFALRATNTWILTHNATSLKLIGGADVSMTNNDVILLGSSDGTNVSQIAEEAVH